MSACSHSETRELAAAQMPVWKSSLLCFLELRERRVMGNDSVLGERMGRDSSGRARSVAHAQCAKPARVTM